MIYFYIFLWLYPSDVLYIQVKEADIFWEVQKLFFHECPLRIVKPAIFIYAFIAYTCTSKSKASSLHPLLT